MKAKKKYNKESNDRKRDRKIARNRMIVINYLLEHPCVDCGEKDLVVLHFDHVTGEKKANISRLITHCASVEGLVAEIAKCDVRCANCHQRKTAKDKNWFKLAYQAELEKI